MELCFSGVRKRKHSESIQGKPKRFYFYFPLEFNAPLEIRTIARKLPHWQMYGGSAGPLPYSIAYGMPYGETDTISLVPYGCTKLRVTEFPVTGNYTIK